MKETVQERTVLKEKVAETFINSKNTMAVLDTDELERHTGGAFHSIFVSAGGTKTAVTAERNEFQCGQLYMAPPKEGSPQPNILSIFSISVCLGWRVYIISS